MSSSLAQDFRRINELLNPCEHPLRKIDELIEELSHKKLKSSLDQDQAYTQMPMHEDDRHETAFSTRNAKCQFVGSPHGTSISGDLCASTKSRFYSSDGGHLLLWLCMWSCVDDDATGTNTVIAHIFNLVSIFDRLKKCGMTHRLAKCRFLEHAVKHGECEVGHRT